MDGYPVRPPYLPPEQLAAANRIIDAAAIDARKACPRTPIAG
jgi:hypothetical protein